MRELKKISLNLNKQVIDQLDRQQAGNIKGGQEAFTSIWGSNCNNSDPNRHRCCEGESSVDPGACTSTGSTNHTAMPGTCCCTSPCNPNPTLE